jgi:hypothetical protein
MEVNGTGKTLTNYDATTITSVKCFSHRTLMPKIENAIDPLSFKTLFHFVIYDCLYFKRYDTKHMTISLMALSIMTISLMALSTMTISLMALSIMTLSVTTLSVMALSIMTLSIMTLSVTTLSITTAQ